MVSAVHSASCARCCTIYNPTGDTVRRSPGETKCKCDNAQPLVNVELDALDDIVVELLGNCPLRRTDVVVSSIPVPIASWELVRNKPWERISFVGEDILDSCF